MRRELIKVDGTVVPLERKHSMAEIRKLIGAPRGLDTVGLPAHGLVMVVDDTGMIDGRPVNEKATAYYHERCRPGTIYSIHGDVVLVPDEDYA